MKAFVAAAVLLLAGPAEAQTGFTLRGFADVGRFADLAGIERVIAGTRVTDAAARVASS